MYTILRTLVVALLLGGCVASVGPGRPPPPPPSEPPPAAPPQREHRDRDRDRGPRIIEGTVTDAETGQPIDRAAVDITSPHFQGEMTTNTGPDGRFRTQEIPPGEFGIRCRRNGYEVWQSKATMGNGIVRLDFQLQRKR